MIVTVLTASPELDICYRHLFFYKALVDRRHLKLRQDALNKVYSAHKWCQFLLSDNVSDLLLVFQPHVYRQLGQGKSGVTCVIGHCTEERTAISFLFDESTSSCCPKLLDTFFSIVITKTEEPVNILSKGYEVINYQIDCGVTGPEIDKSQVIFLLNVLFPGT